PRVGRKTGTLQLVLASEDFNWLSFSRCLERQSEYPTACEVAGEVSDEASIHRPICDGHRGAATVKKLFRTFTIRSFSVYPEAPIPQRYICNLIPVRRPRRS